MNQDQIFFNELEWAGVLDEMQASAWIKDTIPKAAPLVAANPAFQGKEIQMKMRFVEPSTVPLGRWMGCYPELKDGKGDLTIISDWSFSLYALYLAVEEACEDKNLLHKAFLDRSRIKIGITNDVYQPFAPLPDQYSMIRHHSLILYLSFDWLTQEERNNWKAVCHCTGEFVAKALKDCPDPLGEIRQWEESARGVMLKTAELSCTKEGAKQILQDEVIMQDVKRYYALTCFGIDVVARRHALAGESEAWKLNEIHQLSQDDYLEKSILDYIGSYK